MNSGTNMPGLLITSLLFSLKHVIIDAWFGRLIALTFFELVMGAFFHTPDDVREEVEALHGAVVQKRREIWRRLFESVPPGHAEEGDALQRGEILVAPTTNVGWTPLFPSAATVVTDIGAPLSHAAIVARELGIPAVVGCGAATSRLRSGDRVRVDGGLGTVELLDGNL